MAETPKVAVDWSIRNLDTNELIKPQLPMPEDGVSITIGSQLVDQQRFGEQTPITHWTGGLTRNFTFNAVLYARHADEAPDLEDLLDQLIALTEKDESFGRIPICLFRYGSYLSETVLVERVDPTIVSVDSDEFVREVRLSISLRRYTPFSQSQIDPTKPAKESYLRVVSQAEQMFEAIARRYYGDPMLGDRLRKRHPEYPFAPAVGSVVKVPSRSILLKETVAPAFHAFDRDDEDAIENYERILAYRNARQIVEVK